MLEFRNMYLQAYGLVTAAGPRSSDLWRALLEGRDCSSPANGARACRWAPLQSDAAKSGATFDRIFPRVRLAWRDLADNLTAELRTALAAKRISLILASTKGCVDDFVWQKEADLNFDPFARLASEIRDLVAAELKTSPQTSVESPLVMSTACTSTLSAVAWGAKLLAQESDFVIVAAVDAIGPFVFDGFRALKALAPTANRPFSAERTGLQLGEAAGFILLSKEKFSAPLEISAVGLDTEGAAVTRPTANGRSLSRALEQLQLEAAPDAIIAHGTGTALNDSAEDSAYRNLISRVPNAVPLITATKWCVGHTLGASAMVDLVAAAEILKHQKLFRIHNTAAKDPNFRASYFTRDSSTELSSNFNSVVVSSVGFGGMNAAACVSLATNSATLRRTPTGVTSRVTPRPATSLGFKFWSDELSLPLAAAPKWSARVDRWSQLDPPAQALCEAYARRVDYFSLLSPPEIQFLASATGCNETDLDFVESAGLSPSKFVHTLPNIRCSPLLQLMEWNGPFFCFQTGSHPLASALDQQIQALRAVAVNGPLWTWSVRPLGPRALYRVTWCQLSTQVGSQDHEIKTLADLKNLSIAADFV